MRVLGVDPGSVSAAYAFLDTGELMETDDVPVVDRQVNAAEWARIVKRLTPDIAIIELVGAMPLQGSTSGFRFGVGVGLLRGVLAALNVPLVQVTPSKWKRECGLGSNKEAARALAIRLFPGCGRFARVKDAGRAEAALLASWYIRHGTKAA